MKTNKRYENIWKKLILKQIIHCKRCLKKLPSPTALIERSSLHGLVDTYYKYSRNESNG